MVFGFSRFGCQRIAGELAERVGIWSLIVLENDLREGIFDDALGTKFFEVGDDVAGHGILDDDFDGDPAFFGEAGNGGSAEGR